MTTKKGKSLEQLAERIHSVIDRDAKVTWNKGVVDPDTGRLRQVDVLIERGTHVTHVECRDHIGPQDVKWIEELIGRKDSLKADAMIAVSTSGFTPQAVVKAKAKGIFLRDFSELTDQEIGEWGAIVDISANYVEFETIHLHVREGTDSAKTILGSPLMLVIQEIVSQLPDPLAEGVWYRVNASVSFPKGGPACIQSRCRAVKRDFPIASVRAYGEPDVSAASRTTTIDTRTQFKTEAIFSGNHGQITFDLSRIEMPPNHWLRHWSVVGEQIMTMHIETIGNIDFISTSFDVKIISDYTDDN
ncbi:MAG: restriction endonuclease [Phaeospirillum sp.]|nr:restriction endonuclease [Phaeospirillum sp.]